VGELGVPGRLKSVALSLQKVKIGQIHDIKHTCSEFLLAQSRMAGCASTRLPQALGSSSSTGAKPWEDSPCVDVS
jgi:hypothetical protein